MCRQKFFFILLFSLHEIANIIMFSFENSVDEGSFVQNAFKCLNKNSYVGSLIFLLLSKIENIMLKFSYGAVKMRAICRMANSVPSIQKRLSETVQISFSIVHVCSGYKDSYPVIRYRIFHPSNLSYKMSCHFLIPNQRYLPVGKMRHHPLNEFFDLQSILFGWCALYGRKNKSCSLTLQRICITEMSNWIWIVCV